MQILKLSVVALILSTGIVTIPTQAAPVIVTKSQSTVPTDASIMKLIEVTKLVEQMNKMSNNDEVADQFIQGMLVAIPTDSLTRSQRKRFDVMINKYKLEIVKTGDMENLNKKFVEAYIKSTKQHFNQQEVDALIAFHSTAVGQSIIDKQPAMMQDYMSQIMPLTLEAMGQQMKDMNLIPRMTADLKKIMSEK